jgi:hypothetical protein
MIRWFMACCLAGITSVAAASPLSEQPAPHGFPATPDCVMRIYVPTGRLIIETWTRDSIAVRGTVGANASFFGGGDRGHVKFGVEPTRPTDTTLPSADFTVTVPRGARLWVKMIDGELSVTGTTNELEAYAVRGRIAVRNVAGVTAIESIDAPVSVTQARGDLRVRGSKGAVTLDDIEGTASIATISGGVTLTRYRADGRVETIGGPVQYFGGALPGALLDVQTHGGNITLTLNPLRLPQLDLATRAGAVTGDVGKGAAANGRIIARSFKGAISVQRAPK